ncbi:unnamed protein product [Umbelopsis ramanniana]
MLVGLAWLGLSRFGLSIQTVDERKISHTMSVKIIDYAAVKEVEISPDKVDIERMNENNRLGKHVTDSLVVKDHILIHVRDVEEFQAGHIPTALNIPLKEFRETMSLSNDQWLSVYGKEKPNLSDRLVIYCRSGRRSNLASLEAIELQYSWVENYAGSWIEYSSFLAAA